MNEIKFSVNCVKLLKEFEGIKLKPYYDSVKIPTIGIGSTHYNDGRAVTINDKEITEEQAENMCLYHLNTNVLPDLKNHIKVDLNQNQIDALGCLIYNIGSHGFDTSTVLKDINQHIGGDNLKTAWCAWCKAGGKTIDGLLKRREKEYQYFIS
jgi:lysozyme